LFLIICLGLLLRLLHIDAPLASDELTMISIWAQMPFWIIPENYQYPNNHFFLRLPVLLCGVLSLLLGFATTKRMTGNFVVALGVALLLTISTNHIYYSTNARGYMLIILFAQLVTYWTVLVFYHSDTGTWTPPRTPLPLRDLIFLLMFCLLGTWTIPTFVFFEGSLLVFFGFLLLRNFGEKGKFHRSAYVQVMLTVLIALAGFWVQYFILIPQEILEISMTRAPLTLAKNFIPGIWNQWVHPFESATPILIFLWITGLVTLYRNQKYLFALFFSLILVPPTFILFGHFIGLLKSLPAPRVFLYIQPFFFMCVAIGGYEIISKIHQFIRTRFRRKRSAFATLPLFYLLCFLPAGYQAGHELSQTIYPQRMSRELFHQIHRFIKNSGPHDLFLASNQIHIEFFLYGAKEMLTRVESIIESGKLENIYFIGSSMKGRTDIEWIENGKNSYFKIADYAIIGVHNSSVPLKLPAGTMKVVMQAGNLRLYKIRQDLIRKVYALNTPEDVNQWNFVGEAPWNKFKPKQGIIWDFDIIKILKWFPRQ